MARDKTYDEATEVTVEDGEIVLDGPDAVDVKMTPDAAEETAENLLSGVMKAHGQRRLKTLSHRPR